MPFASAELEVMTRSYFLKLKNQNASGRRSMQSLCRLFRYGIYWMKLLCTFLPWKNSGRSGKKTDVYISASGYISMSFTNILSAPPQWVIQSATRAIFFCAMETGYEFYLFSQVQEYWHNITIQYKYPMVHEITLDTPVLEAIEHPEYAEFMKTGESIIHYSAVNTGRKLAVGIFEIRDTIRTAWNEVTLWRPHYCWKKHEQPKPDREPRTCLKRNNPCCGHPFFSKLFQTYWLAGWLAKEKDPTLVHPGQILRHLIDIDFEAIHRYGTWESYGYDPISP